MKQRTRRQYLLVALMMIVTMIGSTACGSKNQPVDGTQEADQTVMESSTAEETVAEETSAEESPEKQTDAAQTEDDKAAGTAGDEKYVSAQTFTLEGGIPFEVSSSERYSEEKILQAAALVTDESSGNNGLISLSYDESISDRLVTAAVQRYCAENMDYYLSGKEAIALVARIQFTAKANLYDQYFYLDYHKEEKNVAPELKESVFSYLLTRLADYNQDYAELELGLTVSDQANEEKEAWLNAFAAMEKRFPSDFTKVEPEVTIFSVKEQGNEVLIGANEMLSIEYAGSKCSTQELHLLVLKKDDTGYTLVHDYCYYIRDDDNFEGIESYISMEPKEKIEVLVWDKKTGKWKRDGQVWGQEISIEEFGQVVAGVNAAQAKELMAQKEEWFAEYNGEKLQRAGSATFYRADEGESLEEILKCMVDSWYDDLPRTVGGCVITDYFLDIEEQPIYDSEEMVERATAFAWSWWLNYRESYRDTVSAFVYQVMALGTNDSCPLDENTWLIPYLNIYTKYEGTNFLSWDEYVSSQGELMKNGCMPQIREGSGAAFQYILMKKGNVYRLQKADEMNYSWAYYGSFWNDEAYGKEFEYELTSGEGSYYIAATEMGEGKYIGKESDSYIVIGSRKVHSGQVILNEQQKALLDGGATMKVMCDGQELDRITMRLSPEYRDGKWVMEMLYVGDGGLGSFTCLRSPDDNGLAAKVAGIDLTGEPYGGVGYYLETYEKHPASFYGFVWDDSEVRLELSGDIPIELSGGEFMTVAEFYENKTIYGFGMRFLVYEEDGQVVKLYGRATP